MLLWFPIFSYSQCRIFQQKKTKKRQFSNVVFYTYTYANHTIQLKYIYSHIQIHRQKQADCVVQVRMVLLTSWLRPIATRGERHDSYYANHPQHAVNLVVFKISVGRDLKNPTTCLNGRELNSSTPWLNPQLLDSMVKLQLSTDLFQNLQILRTISSRHDVIHSPASFPVWGFIMTMVIIISFAREHKTVSNDYTPELFTWIVQSPTKLNDRI